MAPKRPVSSSASNEPKKKRKMMTVNEKVKLLDMLAAGKTYAHVARHYGLNESTVRYIKKDEVNIRKTASISFSKDTKRVVSTRNKNIVKMENVLSVWISDCREKKISLDSNKIRTKAKDLYDSLVPDDEDDDDESRPSTSTAEPQEKRGFAASKGWFENFKKRYGLQTVSLYGEASSVDHVAAKRYVEVQFPKIIKENGYLPEQVFNMDETGLFWKRMPSRTFLYKDELKRPGFKAHKDCLTFIMCGNAAGFMIKPALIYRSNRPHALKNKNRALLPVYWMSNKKAWITKALTNEWFLNCFIPSTKLYLAERGLPFKVLLVMDCAGGHATNLHYEGVQVEFLPPNTTSLIQPMDQGLIRAFKALYTRSTMQGLISSIDEDNQQFSIKEYWRSYNIATCLTNIQNAISDMKEKTIISSWKNLWPKKITHDYEGFTAEEVHHSAVDKAVKLARSITTDGFSDMTTEDVNTLLECHSTPLTDEDLIEMTKSGSDIEEAEDDNEDEERGLTLRNLQEIFNMARSLQRRVQEIDDNMVRAIEFGNRLDGVMSLYKNIFVQKKKQRSQLPITMFLVHRKPPAEASPAASTPPPAPTTPPAAPSTSVDDPMPLESRTAGTRRSFSTSQSPDPDPSQKCSHVIFQCEDVKNETWDGGTLEESKVCVKKEETMEPDISNHGDEREDLLEVLSIKVEDCDDEDYICKSLSNTF